MRVLVFGMVAVGLLMAFSSIGRAVKDKSLVLYYNFEEGSGDKVVDKSGKGNDATIKGKLQWADGKYGSALLFDGNAANYVDAGIPPFDGLVDGGTMEAWIKPSNLLPQVVSVVRKDHDFNLFILTANPKAEWMNEGNLHYPCQGKTILKVNEWYHIAATWDGKTIILYLDGKLENTSSTGVIFSDTGPHPLYIGLGAVYGQPMYGIIDEVAMYDRPLTAKELKQDMEGVSAASVAPSGKLATAWGCLKIGAVR